MAQLNDKQIEAAYTILHAVDDYTQTSSPTQGHCFFIDHPAQTGSASFVWTRPLPYWN